MFPILPIAIASLAGIAYLRSRKDKGLTAERKLVYETALATEKDPAKLIKLGDAYKAEGLKSAGEMLHKRAKLRLLPEPVKEQRREAFKKGMTSTDPVKVQTLAKAFNAEGATGAASALNKYASGLKTAEKAKAKPKAQPKKKVVTHAKPVKKQAGNKLTAIDPDGPPVYDVAKGTYSDPAFVGPINPDA